MTRILTGLVGLWVLLCISACSPERHTQGGVFLPQGDALQGEAHFVSLGCVNCHVVVGAELPEPAADSPIRVRLGSRTGRTLTYGQLVTSIVNPSHRLATRYRKDEVSEQGQSLMVNLNDVITVAQLTDLVAFLQAHYEKAERPGYKYPVYTYDANEAPGGSGSSE